MCGRYSFYPDKTFSNRFRLSLSPVELAKIKSNTNVTPGQIMPVITQKKSTHQLSFLTWGFVPTWAKDDFKPLINARSETILEKPSFRDAFLSYRCLVPATGFYEWSKKVKAGAPHHFDLKGENVFAFAGLYSPKGYSIITTSANSLVAPTHHRMPVILDKSAESIWLDPDSKTTDLVSLLKPLSSDLLSESFH